jgi:hypothetical protein
VLFQVLCGSEDVAPGSFQGGRVAEPSAGIFLSNAGRITYRDIFRCVNTVTAKSNAMRRVDVECLGWGEG